MFSNLPLDILKLILSQTDWETVCNLRLTCKDLRLKLKDIHSLWFWFEHPINVDQIKRFAYNFSIVFWKWNDRIHKVRFTLKKSKRKKGKIIVSSIAYYDTLRYIPKNLENHNKIYQFLQLMTKGRILVPFLRISTNQTIYDTGHFNSYYRRIESTDHFLIDIFNYPHPLKFSDLIRDYGHQTLIRFIELHENLVPIKVRGHWNASTLLEIMVTNRQIRIDEFLKDLNLALLNDISLTYT